MPWCGPPNRLNRAQESWRGCKASEESLGAAVELGHDRLVRCPSSTPEGPAVGCLRGADHRQAGRRPQTRRKSDHRGVHNRRLTCEVRAVSFERAGWRNDFERHTDSSRARSTARHGSTVLDGSCGANAPARPSAEQRRATHRGGRF